ncbi:MAG: hypothetical protein IRZ33_03565 [Alicyclobacillaceae bacterium]|nr:hypothetical protein [Alicyclobacillaceae bacterium]
METLPFSTFYQQIDTKRLEAVYEGFAHETVARLRERLQQGESADAVLRDFLAQLPSVVLDVAAVMCTHLLHEYHDWLASQSAEGGDRR